MNNFANVADATFRFDTENFPIVKYYPKFI